MVPFRLVRIAPTTLLVASFFIIVSSSCAFAGQTWLAGYLDTAPTGSEGAVRLFAYLPDADAAPQLTLDGAGTSVQLMDLGGGSYALDIGRVPSAGRYLLGAESSGAHWPYLRVSAESAPRPTPIPSYEPSSNACNPLGTERCLLPYPSSHYLKRDATTGTGYRVNVSSYALPLEQDPSRLNSFDGWGLTSSLIAEFPGELEPSLFPEFTDTNTSIRSDSRFLVYNIDADSPEFGHQHAVHAERYYDGGHSAVVLLPSEALEPDTRYMVALRNLVDTSGHRATPSVGFEALRDGFADGTLIQRMIPAYEGMFAFLAERGIARGELDMVWDFHTASSQSLTFPMEHMVQDAHRRFDPATAEWSVVETDTSKGVMYVCSLRGPNYIGLDKTYTLDDENRPQYRNDSFFRFILYVPDSAAEASQTGPVPVALFGHGMGNDATRVRNGYLDEMGYVGVAVDWVGLLPLDFVDFATIALNGPVTYLPGITDRLQQSVLNATLVSRMVPELGAFLEQEFGRPILDPERHYYFGESLGGIMGSVTMAVDPDLPAGALLVPGGGLVHLIQRTALFGDELIAGLTLEEILAAVFPDPIERQILFGLMQNVFDRVDPVSFARHWSQEPLGDRQPRHILIQEGMGDDVVPNFNAHFLISASGLPLLAPYQEWLPGVPTMAAPTDGSTYGGVFQFPNGGHQCGREPEARAQQDAFYRSLYLPEYGPPGTIIRVEP